jgi:hypothetical protein
MHIDIRKAGRRMDQEEFLTIDDVAALIECSKFTVYGRSQERESHHSKSHL